MIAANGWPNPFLASHSGEPEPSEVNQWYASRSRAAACPQSTAIMVDENSILAATPPYFAAGDAFDFT